MRIGSPSSVFQHPYEHRASKLLAVEEDAGRVFALYGVEELLGPIVEAPEALLGTVSDSEALLGQTGRILLMRDRMRGSLAAYELEDLETGKRMALRASDWATLLGLAHQYEWRPTAGLDHHLHKKSTRVVPSPDARALAEALKKALKDLPRERRREFRTTGGFDSLAAGTMRSELNADPKDYFAWRRRWIVEEVIRICERGALKLRPM